MAFVTHTPFIERVFVIPQSDDILKAPGIDGAQLIRVVENGCKITPAIPITPVNWKTGTRSPQPGIQGRKSAKWELRNMPVIPSGSSSTAPDADMLYSAAFGQLGSGASYTLSDAQQPPLFALASFPHNQAGLTAMYAYGCVVEQLEFTFNGNIFEQTITGTAHYAIDNRSYADEPDEIKGEVGGFPSEPSEDTVNGKIIPGYGGLFSVDGNALGMRMVSAKITFKTGYKLQEVFGSAYPQLVVAGIRETSCEYGFVNTDEAELTYLMAKAKFAVPVNVASTVGVDAGYKVNFGVNQIQMAEPELSDNKEFVQLAFKNSMAHATTIGTTDEFELSFS